MPLLSVLLLPGCGYVGEPLPPSLKIPSRIADLSAVQKSDIIEIKFTIPSLTTDGVGLGQVETVELRAGPQIPAPWDFGRWAEQAKAIQVEAETPGPVRVEVPVAEWENQEILIAVRASGRKGRFSDWSELVPLRVVSPVVPPSGLKAENTPSGVRLSWGLGQHRDGLAFRVYRRAGEETGATLLGETAKGEYMDTGTRFGTTYEYSVQATLKSGASVAESQAAGPVSITPEDRFPPAVPSGVNATAGAAGIALSWDPNTESDLRGYRVYRQAEAGQLEPLADVETPNHNDRSAKSGTAYRYAVSALDQVGNESDKSAPAEVKAR